MTTLLLSNTTIDGISINNLPQNQYFNNLFDIEQVHEHDPDSNNIHHVNLKNIHSDHHKSLENNSNACIKQTTKPDIKIIYTKDQLQSFKLTQLKELIRDLKINKYNKIFNGKQQKDSKIEHIEHILLFYKRVNSFILIQSWWRKMLVKLLMYYSNFHKIKQCINDNDYLTFEDISQVPCSNLFCYPVTTTKYHAFEYFSFSSLINHKHTQSKNPYTNVEFPLNIFIYFRHSIKISFSIFGNTRNNEELDTLQKLFVPVQEIIKEYKYICLFRDTIVQRMNKLSFGSKIITWILPNNFFDYLSKEQMIIIIHRISKFCKSRHFYNLPHCEMICDTHNIFPLIDEFNFNHKTSSELQIQTYFYNVLKALIGINKLSIDHLYAKKNPSAFIKHFIEDLEQNETALHENSKYLGAYIILSIINNVTNYTIDEIKHIDLELILDF